MTPGCIHGVPTQQCAACRDCSHGLAASHCRRCREAPRKAPVPAAQPAQRHEDYEIFFVPTENSWYYRAPDADGIPSRESYRSAFMARNAVNQVLAGGAGGGTAVAVAPAKKRKR